MNSKIVQIHETIVQKHKKIAKLDDCCIILDDFTIGLKL